MPLSNSLEHGTRHSQADVGQTALVMLHAAPPQQPPVEMVLTSLINDESARPETLTLWVRGVGGYEPSCPQHGIISRASTNQPE